MFRTHPLFSSWQAWSNGISRCPWSAWLYQIFSSVLTMSDSETYKNWMPATNIVHSSWLPTKLSSHNNEWTISAVTIGFMKSRHMRKTVLTEWKTCCFAKLSYYAVGLDSYYEMIMFGVVLRFCFRYAMSYQWHQCKFVWILDSKTWIAYYFLLCSTVHGVFAEEEHGH